MRDIQFSFWSELLKPKYVEMTLPDLAEYGFGINLAVRPSLIGKIANIVEKCNQLDIDLAFWPLLSYRNGYWVNAWNLGIQKKWIRKLMDKYPSVDKYILDLEAPLNFKGVRGMIKTKKLSEVKPWREVRDDMEDLINEMHNCGKNVISTNYPTNPSRRRNQGTPRPRNADMYSYMVYTSLFAIFGNDISKNNVIGYAGRKIMDAHDEKQAIIDLGLTSGGVLPKFLPVTTRERIISEISICKYLGFKRIQIFALDEIRHDITKWMDDIRNATPEKPPIEKNPKDIGLVFRIFRKFLLSESLRLEE